MLYSLFLFNERQKGFFIGLFVSHEKARQIAEYYLSAALGFRDYPCTYEITEKPVIGTVGRFGKVHMIWGWNEDEDGKETFGAAVAMRMSRAHNKLWKMPGNA